MAQWKAHSPTSFLCQLRHTALALTDLHLLANEYFVKIELSKYTQVCMREASLKRRVVRYDSTVYYPLTRVKKGKQKEKLILFLKDENLRVFVFRKTSVWW